MYRGRGWFTDLPAARERRRWRKRPLRGPATTFSTVAGRRRRGSFVSRANVVRRSRRAYRTVSHRIVPSAYFVCRSDKIGVSSVEIPKVSNDVRFCEKKINRNESTVYRQHREWYSKTVSCVKCDGNIGGRGGPAEPNVSTF